MSASSRSSFLAPWLLALRLVALGLLAGCGVGAERASGGTPPSTESTVVESVEASLDDGAFAVLDDELSSAVAAPHILGALAVVIDPRDGRLVAMHTLGAGPGPDDEARAHGSVAKAFSLAIALDRGAVAEDDTFDGAPLTRGPYTIADHVPHGTMRLEDVVVFSSNVGLTHIIERLGPAALLDGLAAFHLGHRLPAGVGDDPPRAARVGYGAELSATPLEVASAFAAIAGGGVFHAPWRTGEPASEGERVISATAAARVLALLEASVSREDGTAHRASVPGYRVAGKTGTVHIDHTTHGAFVGAVPADAPRFVVLIDVIAEGHGYSGGTLAAPLFARVAERLLAL